MVGLVLALVAAVVVAILAWPIGWLLLGAIAATWVAMLAACKVLWNYHDCSS